MKAAMYRFAALEIVSATSILCHCLAQPVDVLGPPSDSGLIAAHGTSLSAAATKPYAEQLVCTVNHNPSWSVGTCNNDKNNPTWTVQDCLNQCVCLCDGLLECPKLMVGDDCYGVGNCIFFGGCHCSIKAISGRDQVSNVTFIPRADWYGNSTTCSAGTSAMLSMSAFSLALLVAMILLNSLT